MAPTINITRKYIEEPPKNYSIQLPGNLQTKGDIAQHLSVSLSSPNVNSYVFDIQPTKTTVWHKHSSHQRLIDTRGTLRELQAEVAELREKDRERQDEVTELREKDRERQDEVANLWKKYGERDMMDEQIKGWEVFSRLAQAVNDDIIAEWRSGTDHAELVKALESNKVHFLPYTMTAEAISWRAKYPDDASSTFAIERFYLDTERESYLRAAERNSHAQKDIDRAWELLEYYDKVNLELMLTSWAKRTRGRNIAVHMVPSTAFAESYIAADVDFRGEVGKRAKEYIQSGRDSHGIRLFDD